MEARGAPAGAPWPPFLCKLPSGRGGAKRLHSSASRQSGEEGAKRLHSSASCLRGEEGQNASIPMQAAKGGEEGAKRLHSSLCKPPKVARKGGKVMNRRGFPLLRPLTHRSALARLCAPWRERSCEVCPSRMGKPSMNP